MEFEWDAGKSERTRAARGFNFSFAKRVFDDPRRIDRPDLRRDYGEDRRQTIGDIDGEIYFVVYTPRGGVVRIISARRAHDNEKRAYGATLGEIPGG
ncbi:MAG: BrnT family toxin [Rhodospirillaceae bacterium]|nr:BrnT family toxin [Rhodospirillaceae bacterium]